ncbi:MAG TPA: hypothetical protein VFE98_08475 [Candidatus Bathyarchaeia archaeon]|nr:hypothetical protein [Candidatus Bathyarchaeia archaeon]
MNRGPGSVLGSITVGAVIISILTYILSLGVGTFAIVTTQLGRHLLDFSTNLPIGLFFQVFRIGLRINLLAVVDACIMIFALCFFAAAIGKGGVLPHLKIVAAGSWPPKVANWLIVMPLLGSGLLVIVIILTIGLSAAGLPSGGLLPTSQAELFASLTYAPVLEEMAFRISIFAPLLWIRIIWNLIRYSDRYATKHLAFLTAFIVAIFSPDRAKQMAKMNSVWSNGVRGIHWSEWTVLVVSTILFGLAHILSGAGWEAGKAITAGLSGFALGVVYLVYGAYGNILLHWFFNFYFFVFTLVPGFGDFFLLLGDLIALFAFAVGVLGIIVGAVTLKRALAARRTNPLYDANQPGASSEAQELASL